MEIYKNLSLEDMEGEIWKDIEGYEGLYQVSNMGRVKSLERMCKSRWGKTEYYRTVHSKILSQTPYTNGYLMIELSKNGKVKKFLAHRLVAMNFIENTENKPTVDHKNTIVTDNRVENLRWFTHEQQMRENEATKKKCKEAIASRKQSYEQIKKQVRCITTGKVFNSITEASRYYNVTDCLISRCCKGTAKYTGTKTGEKLTWEYID